MSSTSTVPQRFFYHSFPRRRGDTDAVENDKGLAILRIMKDKGLLFTPEHVEWPVFKDDIKKSVNWGITQRRCCFTELSPSELPQHADIFGHFALEFEIPDLRFLGAFPVVYIHRVSNTAFTGLGDIAQRFVQGLGETGILLERMQNLEQALAAKVGSESEPLVIIRESTRMASRCSYGGALDLLSSLTESLSPIGTLAKTLDVLGSFFYPVDDPDYTSLLGYYRQREWRISADVAKSVASVVRPVDPDERELLVQLDAPFFTRRVPFRKGTYERVDSCEFFESFGGKPLIQCVRRAIVPFLAVPKAREILSEPNDPEVVALESMSVTEGEVPN